ncbi:MAG: hypothetical protein Ct9H90mP25_0090 [Gammaproteobacteria bacterium]|nr:MAG: hypothetical protein Ct9H90mP25_0090 [Gammaproteobacteria bacterium]
MLLFLGIFSQDTDLSSITVTRLMDQPIIRPDLHPRLDKISRALLNTVPDWVADPLGKYYLYFADHKGRYIRLAYSDELTGPWKIHEAGLYPLSSLISRRSPSNHR